jgi:hypothetical protein
MTHATVAKSGIASFSDPITASTDLAIDPALALEVSIRSGVGFDSGLIGKSGNGRLAW